MTLERPVAPDPYELLPQVASFTLESGDVEDRRALDVQFAHSSVGGQNVSPELHWSGFPAETKSFAVTCFDPDAPTGSGFWHWVLVGLPSNLTELARGAGSGGALPAGAFHVRNDYSERSYGGSAPPAGDRPHRYVFAVHAVDVEKLDVTQDVSAAFVGFNLTFHVIARGVIRPTFQV